MSAWERFVEKLKEDEELADEVELCETAEELAELAAPYGVSRAEIEKVMAE